MKKNILFHKILIFSIIFASISCFNTNKNIPNASTIVITNLSCDDCTMEINAIIKNLDGIDYHEIWISNDSSVLLLNIQFNDKKITLEKIKEDIKSEGFTVDLINSNN
tara:strand:+ start:22870 stop:23193 length:324 start_codon:yes stop_codon:yes gene_type:complete